VLCGVTECHRPLVHRLRLLPQGESHSFIRQRAAVGSLPSRAEWLTVILRHSQSVDAPRIHSMQIVEYTRLAELEAAVDEQVKARARVCATPK
jgi:hypothetical protein